MTAAAAGSGAEPVATIGRYLLRERLATGATGYVYEAVDQDTNLVVAVKVIAADLQDEPETRERFYREARITGELAHPNIVRVLDVGEDHGRPFIAMERLDGLPLRDYLQKRPAMTVAERLALIVQIFEGLGAAHAHGAVHRDVKPGNIFVQHDGCVKLLDFGLARLRASTLTASGVVVGSPGYMSPEQVEGRRVDERSDIFSASAVSYLILTGRPPFEGRNLPEVLQAVLQEAPAPIADAEAPGALARIIDKALRKSSDDRYQTCAEALSELRAVRDCMVHQ